MTPLRNALTTLCAHAVTHLWQSTLVLAGLFLLSQLLRHAPAACQERLWGLGFLKLFLPLLLFGSLCHRLLRAIVPDTELLPLAPFLRPSSVGACLLDPVESLANSVILSRALLEVAAAVGFFAWGIMAAAKQFTFEPGRKDGKPIAVDVVVPIQYAPD